MILARSLAVIALGALALGAVPASLSLERERILLDIPSAQGALDSATFINERAHYAGTAADKFVAGWMRDKLRDAGFEARTEPFTAEVYTPTKLAVSLLTTPRVTFELREVPIPSDPDGTRRDAGLPFNAGSGNGSVVARVVDAGHGLDADYAALAARNVAVRGAIALVRYGKEFRGDLARRAQTNGAVGVIFFSDPADDSRGGRYPNGPNQPLGAVQRGSLGSPRLAIPVLPISDVNARQILADMRGGVTVANARVDVYLDRKVETLWNTVGTIEGSDPSQSVVLGAHRDAWVYGVTDNGSGTSILIEVARALGYLHRSGWQPQRSITIVGFDGEEIGEAGSMTYVRVHQDELRGGAVAYFNTDEDTTGQTFDAMAVGALASSVVAATKRVRDPHTERQTIYDRWLAQSRGVTIDSPAGGSDYQDFLYDLGIPVLEVAFDGSFGVYHSGFDDLQYAKRFGDTGFVNHRAVAQMLALLALRYADAPVLPYRFSDYVTALRADLKAIATPYNAAQVAVASQAVDRFAPVATAFDAHPNPLRNADALAAARALDRVLYARNRYAAVAFPDLANAPAEIDAAAARLR